MRKQTKPREMQRREFSGDLVEQDIQRQAKFEREQEELTKDEVRLFKAIKPQLVSSREQLNKLQLLVEEWQRRGLSLEQLAQQSGLPLSDLQYVVSAERSGLTDLQRLMQLSGEGLNDPDFVGYLWDKLRDEPGTNDPQKMSGNHLAAYVIKQHEALLKALASVLFTGVQTGQTVNRSHPAIQQVEEELRHVPTYGGQILEHNLNIVIQVVNEPHASEFGVQTQLKKQLKLTHDYTAEDRAFLKKCGIAVEFYPELADMAISLRTNMLELMGRFDEPWRKSRR